MYKIFQSFFLLIFLSLSVYSDEDLILDSVMNEMEFIAFKERVGQAVAKHPRFKSAQASLEAAFAQVKGSESYLRPQLSVILDSNNAISRKYKFPEIKQHLLNLECKVGHVGCVEVREEVIEQIRDFVNKVLNFMRYNPEHHNDYLYELAVKYLNNNRHSSSLFYHFISAVASRQISYSSIIGNSH